MKDKQRPVTGSTRAHLPAFGRGSEGRVRPIFAILIQKHINT